MRRSLDKTSSNVKGQTPDQDGKRASNPSIELSAEELDTSEQVEELEPTEEEDTIYANRRQPPLIQDDVMTLLLNHMLEAVIDTWEGSVAMRPIMKVVEEEVIPPPEIVVEAETPVMTVEAVDVLSNLALTPGRRSSTLVETKTRRNRQETITTLVNPSVTKRGSKPGMENKASGFLGEKESIMGRPVKLAVSKKKRTSKDRIQRMSIDYTGFESEKLHAPQQVVNSPVSQIPSISGGPSSTDPDKAEDVQNTSTNQVDMSNTVQDPSPPASTVDSWRRHFPDENVNIRMQNGNQYAGRTSRKLMEGDGKFKWDDGSSYKGTFVGGEMTGNGKLTWPDTSWYEGNVVKGWRHGRGLYVQSDWKFAYLGDWVAGCKQGHGILYYNETGTEFYEGGWYGNLRDGYGLRVYESGARYIGYWRKGLRHGPGTMMFANGDLYQGQWEEGMMHGFGEYRWGVHMNKTLACPVSNIHSGWFKQGMRHGEGTCEMLGGQQIHGVWQNDMKEGPATLLCGDGSVHVDDPMFERDRAFPHRNENKSTQYELELLKLFQPEPQQQQQQSTARSKPTQKRRLSSVQAIASSTKPPLPEPSRVAFGHYYPVHAPPEDINLRYYLDLLKALKHPSESTGCQTVDGNFLSETADWWSLLEESDKPKEMCKRSPRAKVVPNIKGRNKKTQTPFTQVHKALTPPAFKKSDPKAKRGTSPKNLQRNDTKSNIMQKGQPLNIPERKKRSHSLVAIGSKKFSSSKASIMKIMAQKLRDQQTYLQKSLEATLHRRKVVFPGCSTEEEFEEKWLRLTIVRHLPVIRQVYEDYARLGCGMVDLGYKPVLLRMMLWQLYRDCKITDKISIVDLDAMLFSNPSTQTSSIHFPFEKIQFWQFIYSLIDISWILYASKGVGRPNSRGALGSALDKVIYDDILTRPARSVGQVFTEYQDLLPLESIYLLYRSLGEPLTARKLLQKVCLQTKDWDVVPCAAVAHYPDHIMDGTNAIVFGGNLAFVPQPPPLTVIESPVYVSATDDIHSTVMSTFRNVGIKRLTKIMVEICPLIKEEGIIVNIGYEMVFLEFYEVLLSCTNRSILKCQREERRLARLAEYERNRQLGDDKVDEFTVKALSRTKTKKSGKQKG